MKIKNQMTTTPDQLDYTKLPLVFNVYKSVGPSSFNVVHHFKKNLDFDFGKIGHFGTLDPFAQGVLLIGIQGAQKLNDYIHQLLPKTYRAKGLFGGKTDTGDHTSAVVESRHLHESFKDSTVEEIEALMREHFLGEYWQAPHSVSATKFEGKRLYVHALEGRLIQKEKVKREILDLKIISFAYPQIEFLVTVSSGTYVRSLFEEMSALMGGLGALNELERVSIGSNTVAEALKKEQWPQKGERFNLEQFGRPLDQVIRLNKVRLTDLQTRRYVQGQRFLFKDIEVIEKENIRQIDTPELWWVYSPEGILIGLARQGELLAESELRAIFNLQLSIALFS